VGREEVMKEKIKGFKYTCNHCKKEVIHSSETTLPEGWFETSSTDIGAAVSLRDWKGRPVLQMRGDEHFCSIDCHGESCVEQMSRYEELVAVPTAFPE
jgi:hypothetical protein